MIQHFIRQRYTYLFLGITVLILWQLLLPGYVLSLDMVFAPEFRVVDNMNEDFKNSWPLLYLLQGINYLVPGWVVQKIVLLAIFFGIMFLAFNFFPSGKNNRVKLLVSLFYLFNPFVYSRFLAGNWGLLLAYAWLPVWLNFLISFTKFPRLKSALKLGLVLFIVGIFSLHFLIITLMITGFLVLVNIIKNILLNKNLEYFKQLIKPLLITVLLFVLINSYWFIPLLSRKFPVEQQFDLLDWQVFSAVGHNNINPTVNLLVGGGFWGENVPWGNYFLWPSDYLAFWLAVVLIVILIVIGINQGWRDRDRRFDAVWCFIIGFLSFVFAAGVGETVFKPINWWLYEHIFFWRGFRDSQKFIGFTILIDVIFIGWGIEYLLNLFEQKRRGSADNLFIGLLFIPVTIGFLFLGGFHRQLFAVDYPESWYKVKNILEADQGNYRVLFLPWHGYFSAQFNNNLIIHNPAKVFFSPKIISSDSVEIGNYYGHFTNNNLAQLDSLIREESNLPSEDLINLLSREYQIKYIIFSQDLIGSDNFKYSFLKSNDLKIIVEKPDLTMLKFYDNVLVE